MAYIIKRLKSSNISLRAKKCFGERNILSLLFRGNEESVLKNALTKVENQNVFYEAKCSEASLSFSLLHSQQQMQSLNMIKSEMLSKEEKRLEPWSSHYRRILIQILARLTGQKIVFGRPFLAFFIFIFVFSRQVFKTVDSKKDRQSENSLYFCCNNCR